MPRKRTVVAEVSDWRTPEWQPLLNLLAGDFMWMFAVETKGGRRIDAYKHYWTRRYLHLDHEGRAYVYKDNDRYEEVDPTWLLDIVLRRDTADDWLPAKPD